MTHKTLTDSLHIFENADRTTEIVVEWEIMEPNVQKIVMTDRDQIALRDYLNSKEFDEDE